jgi:hypothetical protein
MSIKGYNVETHTKELLLFRGKKVSRGSDNWMYMRSGSYSSANWIVDPLEAKDFNGEEPAKLVRSMEAFAKDQDSPENVQLVKVTIITQIEPIDLNQGEILEERRRQALAKLSAHEIEALGVERLAAYSKLKFHGSSD